MADTSAETLVSDGKLQHTLVTERLIRNRPVLIHQKEN